MKEIKIKAWHKLLKEFVKPHKFLVLNADGQLCNDDVEILQFTGLKDKNGVEIYEGDLLKMDDLIIPVIFHDGSFQIKTNDYQGSSHLMQDRARRFEVIGNMNQNPELLK